MNCFFRRATLATLLASFAALQACQSTGSNTSPKVTRMWNERIGNYSYAQATTEYGQPSSTKDLGNGLKEATWKQSSMFDSRKEGPTTFTVDRSGMMREDTQKGVVGFKEETLILLFDGEGKLRSWNRK